MLKKPGEKEFLKSYIGLSSCHLTSNGQPACQAGFIGACQLGPQKDNAGIFLPMVLVIKVVTNIFFSETYNDFIFLSLDSRCEASSKQEVGSKLGQLSSSKLLSDLKNTLFLLITCFLPCLLIQYDLSLES